MSAALDVYLSTVNNNLSLIMKRLTGITVILAGIGAFAGIFGMSEAGAAFRLGEAPGFWIVTFGITGLAVLDRGHPAPDRLDLRRAAGARAGRVGARLLAGDGLRRGVRGGRVGRPHAERPGDDLGLADRPRGPSDVWSHSCSSVAAKASSRLLWLRRTRVIS